MSSPIEDLPPPTPKEQRSPSPVFDPNNSGKNNEEDEEEEDENKEEENEKKPNYLYPYKKIPENNQPSDVIGVFGLSPDTKKEDLDNFFSQYGTIIKTYIVYDKKTGYSKGFGFVYFKNIEDSVKAKEDANGRKLNGNSIRTDYSTTNKPRPPTPGKYLGKTFQRKPRYFRPHPYFSRPPPHHHHNRPPPPHSNPNPPPFYFNPYPPNAEMNPMQNTPPEIPNRKYSKHYRGDSYYSPYPPYYPPPRGGGGYNGGSGSGGHHRHHRHHSPRYSSHLPPYPPQIGGSYSNHGSSPISHSKSLTPPQSYQHPKPSHLDNPKMNNNEKYI